MVVQHNMQAANASRMLNITAGAQSKSIEKLSSGFRINRAADDAAGLSISEKNEKAD
jgi:flagellin